MLSYYMSSEIPTFSPRQQLRQWADESVSRAIRGDTSFPPQYVAVCPGMSEKTAANLSDAIGHNAFSLQWTANFTNWARLTLQELLPDLKRIIAVSQDRLPSEITKRVQKGLINMQEDLGDASKTSLSAVNQIKSFIRNLYLQTAIRPDDNN